MKQKSLLSTFILVLGLVAFTILNTSYSGGFGGSYQTGGCSCHGPANNATTVVMNGLPTFYNVNQSYPISVTVTNTTKTGAGFQIKTNVGMFSTSDPSITVNTFAFNREAGHNATKLMSGPTATFNLIWTAPSTGGTAAIFNASGNAVNSDFSNGGDVWNNAASSNVALPVEINNITAHQKENQILVEFITRKEENVDHFEFQRSLTGLHFETFYTQQPNSEKKYSALDNEVKNGTTYYYRVKEVSTDNIFSYSSMVSVLFKSSASLTIYPTIIENNQLNIMGDFEPGTRLTLYDFLGRNVLTQSNVTSTIQLPNLNTGLYFATLILDNEVLKTQKVFIK